MIDLRTGDCLKWIPDLEDNSIDLVCTSPPYLEARTYSTDGVARKLDEWVAWMVEVVSAIAPKCKGLIAINCEGQTRKYRYLPAPFLLMADLHRSGFHLRKPIVFHRVGIPGSGGQAKQHEDAGGGPDWLRNDWEPIICIARPGKLPWADATACGRPPKWAAGGEMSHRLTDGTKRNQWGGNGTTKHRKKDGTRDDGERPGSVMKTKRQVMTRERPGTHSQESTSYSEPVLANPGNLIQMQYSASEVVSMLERAGDVFHTTVGGGQMGHDIAHENEAPFPLVLPEFFVQSFCRPGGVVCDPFLGSGTTLEAATKWGRSFVGGDLRPEQVSLARRRFQTITPALIPLGD